MQNTDHEAPHCIFIPILSLMMSM